MKYLSPQQILFIHDQAVKRTGGPLGIRDVGILESAVYRPQTTFDGKDLYKTVFDKAASLLQSLIKNHPFIDGNKRTAFITTYNFLALNGVKIAAGNKEIVVFMVQVANKNLSVDEISSWLKFHSRPLKLK